MRPFVLVLAGCLLASPVRATLKDALVAREVLNSVAETCIVRVDFSATAAREPMFALAFSFEQVFWLYAPEVGTRVLGPATRKWPDTDTLSQRLRTLDADVERVTIYANPVRPSFRPDEFYLTNACVIGSINSLVWVIQSGGDASHAGLILMSYDTADASLAAAMQVNHSLLAYQVKGQWWCIDPSHAGKPFPLEHVAVGKPLDPAIVSLTLKHSYPVRSVCLLRLSPRSLTRITSNVRWSTPPLSE